MVSWTTAAVLTSLARAVRVTRRLLWEPEEGVAETSAADNVAAAAVVIEEAA